MGRQASARSDALAGFSRLRVWERAGVRAPNKPLLVLYALGRWAAGERGPVRFADAAGDLKRLLAEFGPARRSYHPEYPFWYLQNDGVWEVRANGPLARRAGKDQPTAGELVRRNAVGEFPRPIREALGADPAAVARIARGLLDAHFPTSIHEDILAAVGLDLDPAAGAAGRPRDPRFREAVLAAYGCRCAVCGLGVRLGLRAVALDAAHIRWHAAGGPDQVSNGLALCALHHRLFDLGAFTVSPADGVVRVSAGLNGDGAQDALIRFDRNPVAKPRLTDHHPAESFLRWHAAEVFHGDV